MEFVSKAQTYDALRKLMLTSAPELHDSKMEELARGMEMQGDKSRDPELYQTFLDTIDADPLEPQDALAAAARFLERHLAQSANEKTQNLIADAKSGAERPEDAPAFWNRWMDLLSSV